MLFPSLLKSKFEPHLWLTAGPLIALPTCTQVMELTLYRNTSIFPAFEFPLASKSGEPTATVSPSRLILTISP